MSAEEKQIGPAADAGRGWPGIRLKLFGVLLPLVFLLIGSMTWVITGVTESILRRDLIQRGAAISRVVALSAGYSLLSNDPLGLDRLVSETRASDPDIAFVAVRDASDIVAAHDRVTERGKPFRPVPPLLPLGTFGDTRADEVERDGRRFIEYTTPISFAGRRLGISSLALSMEGLAAAQRSIRRRIFAAAAVTLAVAFFVTLLLSSFITTPVKRLHQGVLALGGGETFQPVPARSSDELGDLTRNFNRMAEKILAQKTDLRKKADQLEEAYISMVRVIAASLDARDPSTKDHSTRVALISCALGRRLGMDEEELTHLERAAIFHDIGKIKTPDDVLKGEERLSRAEVDEQMEGHPVDGTEILRMAPFLHRYIPVVRSHHEWYNGNGYPDGTKGDQIPLHAQIISLADAFDAMTIGRPYRQALSSEEAITEILRFRGSQFSPELTDAFAKLVREMPPMENGTLRSIAL
jgi:putative nucleotidyltransferase with HDIG domain